MSKQQGKREPIDDSYANESEDPQERLYKLLRKHLPSMTPADADALINDAHPARRKLDEPLRGCALDAANVARAPAAAPLQPAPIVVHVHIHLHDHEAA